MRVPGGAPLSWVFGASGVGRSPTPDCPPSGRAAGAHYPMAVGAGGCGRGDPSPTPQRALFRVGFARCGGGTRAPGGGASCLGVGRPGSGSLPPTTARPLGGLRGFTTHWLWVRGGAGVGTRHQPHSACSFELALRAVGAAQERPGGGASCLGVGCPGSGALPSPTARPMGGLPGPTTHCLWMRGGAGVGTRHQSHSVRSFELALRAVEAARGRPGGGRLLPGCGASGIRRSPTPDCPPSGRAAGAHYPLAVGAGGCGRGDPSPTPQRALFRAGFARCGGGMTVPGGARPPWVWGVRGWALSDPRLPALWAGCRGPLPTGCGCWGVRAWGPVTNPTARALSTLLCALWGRHEGARGGRLLPGCGASGVGRSPTNDCPPSWRAAGAHYPLAAGAGGCGRGDPSPTPQRALFRAGFARCGGGTRAPGGGRLLPGCGASGVGRSPTPDCPPSGRAVGAHYPLAVGAGGCGRGDPSPTPQRELFRAGFARCGGGRRASGGGHLLPGCGAYGVGRSPTPDCPPSGRAAGAHYPLAVGAGRRGRGDPSPTPQRALLRAGFARCGGGMRVPWGAPLAWVRGVRSRALSYPRLPALSPGCRGPLPTGCGCGGLRAWGPVTNPTARALSSWLCALWGRHDGARGGGAPAWLWGVRGRALSHPRLPALWAGFRGRLPSGSGCGGARAWEPVTNPTARTLAWVWGVRGRALSQPRRPALRAGCRAAVRVRALLGRVGRAGLPGAF